jgi:hypothetical protein
MDDIIKEARELFKLSEDADKHNRDAALDDIRFARLGEQWPDNIRSSRQAKGRPCLTINKMPAYIRQVVNDSRQNKPSIKVSPVDGDADVETAEILSGLIRNIEYTSNADVAYDTAIDNAVTCGFGYWRINIDYAHDDSFDMDLRIQRISNPLSVYRDPFSTDADSGDWNCAFIVDKIKKDQFKQKYKNAKLAHWEEYEALDAPWMEDESVMLAEYWKREEVDRKILLLNDRSVVDESVYVQNKAIYDAVGASVVAERITKSYKVRQIIMSGVDVLEENYWPGIYIPIVPVYGEEVVENGKRYFRSMIRDAKDPLRMLNYWRSACTELVALAPKAPFIGRKGSFTTDAEKWATANTDNHAFIEYDGAEPPQRQPFSGIPAGALQEAMNASDDIKAILGMFEPSMGAQGNETSGRAIIARQRESDTGQFHFVDNQSRGIRHTGRIFLDLIPKVYSGERVLRVIGEDGKKKNIRIGEENSERVDDRGEIEKIYALNIGKYDVVVEAGANYATKRQEAADQMTEMIRVYPAAAPLIGDLLAKNLDWPGAEDIAKRFEAMLPPQVKAADGDDDGRQQIIAQAQEQIQQIQQQAMQAVQQLQSENQQLKAKIEGAAMEAQVKQASLAIDAQKLEIERYKAETDRLIAVSNIKQQYNADMQTDFINQQE